MRGLRIKKQPQPPQAYPRVRKYSELRGWEVSVWSGYGESWTLNTELVWKQVLAFSQNLNSEIMSHLLKNDGFELLNKEYYEEEAPPSFLELEIPTEEMDDFNRFLSLVLLRADK